jgi:hypothetical protein
VRASPRSRTGLPNGMGCCCTMSNRRRHPWFGQHRCPPRCCTPSMRWTWTNGGSFHAFHGECLNLVIEDVLALPDDTTVLVEGFSLLPRLIAPLLGRREQAIWLLPSTAFRRAAFDARGSTWVIPNKTSDPQRALENLLARDALFTEELRVQTAAFQLPSIDVDGSLTIEDSVALVGHALGLSEPEP